MQPCQLVDKGSITDRNKPNASEDELSYTSRFASTPAEATCKKHPGKPSCYFITDEPWVQFCSKCALNMALCGKKIERRLTEDQRRRKLELEGILLELKSKSKIAEEKQVEIKGKLTTIEAQYLIEVENLLRFYDSEIEEWTRKRNEVYKYYSEEILDYFKSLEQVRYRFSLSAMELKSSMQNVYFNVIQIENNFVTIIHDIPITDFQEEVLQHRRNLDRVVENQQKVFQFDNKREIFDKLVKELVANTETFKNTKKWHSTAIITNANNNSALTSMNHSNKFHVVEAVDSRKQQHSHTPQKKINVAVLQQHNLCSKDEQLRLRLKPAVNQVISSNIKTKLVPERTKRINSKPGPSKNEQNNVSRVQRI